MKILTLIIKKQWFDAILSGEKTVETREVRTALVYRLRVQVEDPENVMRQGMPVTITLEPVTP